MIEINLKWELAKSKKDTAKLRLKIEKKSIGIDTSVVVPYLIIRKCDWQHNNIKTLKHYTQQIKALNNINNDIDTYLLNSNNLVKDDIINNIQQIIKDNDYRIFVQPTQKKLSSFFDDYMINKIGAADNTKGGFRSAVKKLILFENHYKKSNSGKDFTINDVQIGFLQQLIDYWAHYESDYNSQQNISRIKSLTDKLIKDFRVKNIIATDSYFFQIDPNKENNINDDLPFELRIFEKMFSLQNLTKKEELTRQWLIVACYTGLRVKDLLTKLNANQIDSKNNLITIMPTKTNKYRKIVYIPIWGHLLDLFKKNNYSLPSYLSHNDFHSNIKKLYQKVDNLSTVNRDKKVKTKTNNGIKTRSTYNTYYVYDCFSPHDCRRFFVTTMLDTKKMEVDDIMIITGHSNPQTLYIYDKRDKKNIMIEKAKELKGKYITSI